MKWIWQMATCASQALRTLQSAMSKHAKTPCPGWEVATFHEAVKREWRGDNLTGKQNSSTTIGTWRLGTAAFSEKSDQDCILSLLLRPVIWTHSLATKTSDLDPTVVLFTQHCVPVSHLCVPHQDSTSTCFRTVFQVSSCLTHLLTARTVCVTQP